MGSKITADGDCSHEIKRGLLLGRKAISNLDVHQHLDEWVKKLWYIHTMEYYSAIKSNAFESVLMRWVNLEPIIQSVSKSERER